MNLKNPIKYDVVENFSKYYKLSSSTLELSIQDILLSDFLFSKIFNETELKLFLMEKNIKSVPKEFKIINSHIYFIYQEYQFKLNSFDEKAISVKELTQSLKETNFLKLFDEYFNKSVYQSILGRMVPRYQYINKLEFYKDILKFKWFDKNDIRIHLPYIIKDVGYVEKNITLKSGKQKKCIFPKECVIQMSMSGVIKANQDWKNSFPEEFKEKDMLIQGGEIGVVFSKKGNYKTAFCEVFPSLLKNNEKIFSSFIRGEGKNIEEAEKNAFNKLLKIKNCTNHKWNRKGRDNGHAFCDLCGVFNSDALEPETKCNICGIPTTDNQINKVFYCNKHFYKIDSFNLLKEKRDDRQKKEYQNYKSRNGLNIKYKIKNSSLSKKDIKKILKEEYNREIIARTKRYYGIEFFYNFRGISHIITKMLLRRNKIQLDEIKHNRNLHLLVFEYINNYSILGQNKSSMKEFIAFINSYEI